MNSNAATGKILIGKLEHGSDLLESLTSICMHEGITMGRVEAIGAVQKANIGYYNQQTREYKYQEFVENMEILVLVGNISLKDSKPMVHAHITLGRGDFTSIGGHLSPGTIVFACEYVITELRGRSLERGYDETTGLPLWVED